MVRTGLGSLEAVGTFAATEFPPPDNKDEGEASAPLQLLGQSTVRAGGREKRAGKEQVLPTSGTFSFLLAVSALFAGSSTQVPQVIPPSRCAGIAWASLCCSASRRVLR